MVAADSAVNALKCGKEHLLAFSCRTRNFCSSCQAKRSVLFAEKVAAEILAPVPHRHWTFSIPRVLRGLFERERSLLGLLSQTARLATASRLCFDIEKLSGTAGSHRCPSRLCPFSSVLRRLWGKLNTLRKTIRISPGEARSTWARLIKKIFEADPLLCTCGGRMRIVSFITDHRVVDRILRHRGSGRCKAQDPFEPRAPPSVVVDSLQ
jgi:hypothetical protein